MSDTARKNDWVLIARILRPRGNKGEVLAELYTDFPARLSSLPKLWLQGGKAGPQAVELRNFWVDRNHPAHGVFHFADFASISDAETLRGFDILLPLAERVALPAGKYFVSDLVGCTVFECPGETKKLASPACEMEDAPRVLGTVRDVFFPGEGVAGTPLLQVETPAGEMLIPLAEDICRCVNVTGRRIDVTLPEGLSDLNSQK